MPVAGFFFNGTQHVLCDSFHDLLSQTTTVDELNFSFDSSFFLSSFLYCIPFPLSWSFLVEFSNVKLQRYVAELSLSTDNYCEADSKFEFI